MRLHKICANVGIPAGIPKYKSLAAILKCIIVSCGAHCLGIQEKSIRGAAAAFKPSNIFKRPLQTCACKRNSLEELSKIEPLIGWTHPACNNDRAAQIEDSRTNEVKGVKNKDESKTERN